MALLVGLALVSAEYGAQATDLSAKERGSAANVSSPPPRKERSSVASYIPGPVLAAHGERLAFPQLLAYLQEPAPPAGDTSQTASLAAHQEPFPFSHKVHGPLSIKCTYCHEDALTGTRARFPAAAKCMTCHSQFAKDSEPIKKLAALPNDTRIVPEKPLYRLPEFVFFSHARHKAGGVGCATCHGDVWQTDVVEAHLPMRMKACVDCHRENHAAITCTTCHEAFQQ